VECETNLSQHNALAKTAVAPGPTITNYRYAPPMSR
jgi:hypothetical protein